MISFSNRITAVVAPSNPVSLILLRTLDDISSSLGVPAYDSRNNIDKNKYNYSFSNNSKFNDYFEHGAESGREK